MNNARKPKIRFISVLCIMFLIISIASPLTINIALAETEQTNIALNKPVTSSDGSNITPAYPPSAAVDGIGLVHDNGWDSQSSLTMSGSWLQVDLQGDYIISKVEIDDRHHETPAADEWDGPRKNFEILASNDPNFTEGNYVVLGGPGSVAFPNNTTWVLDVTETNSYQYVRFVKTIQDYQFLSEMRVFGTLAAPDEPQEPGNAIEFYVAPDGNDNNTGTIDQPFATIEKARDYIRSINSDMDSNIVVYLRGGEYNIDTTIEFNALDSGTNGFTITYKNYPEETPVFTSAQTIPGWTEQSGLFITNVGDLRFRDLFINGQRGMRARTESYSISSWNSAGRTFNISNSAFENWDGFSTEKVGKIEAVLNTHWVESYTRMVSYAISGSNAAVSLAPEGEIIFTRDYPDRAVNQSVHFENAYEFMDKPGEWFLDENNGDLFYIPREGETLGNLDAVIGTIETFVSIKGSMADRVENLVISGITFEYTTFNLPIQNDGIVFSQGGFIRDTGGETLGSGRQPAALYIEGADNVKITRNVFRHMGATGIDIKYMAHNNEVVGNALTDIAGNGIIIGIFNDTSGGFNHNDPLSQARNNKINNNYLRGISADYYCGTGIILGYTNGTAVEHNEISNIGYTAIASGWGWTPNDTSLGNTKINYNNIYQYVTRQSDGAGIYTLSKTPGSEIAGNYIHDDDRNQFASNYPLVAIYLDQASAGYNVHDNVSSRVDVKLNLNMITEGANSFANNDSQDQAIKANAGLSPEYWDIVPETFRRTNGNSWVAPTYGGVRISGDVSVAESVYASVYSAAIYKNDTVIWGPTPVSETPGASYNLCIDVLPNDTISFAAKDGNGSVVDAVYWDSSIKPEVYVPRLVILDITHPDLVEPAEISDKTKTVILKVKPGTDVKDFHPVISTPPGTRLVHEAEEPTDYSSPVKMKVYMEEGSEFLGFDGGQKYKEWEVKVLVDSEAAFFKGFNIGDQIADSDNWHISAGNITADTNSLTFSAGGYSIYKPKMFTDELIEFTMNTPAQGWPAITFRNQSNTAEGIGPDSSCYITVIKPDVIELQRFNNGVRIPLYISGVGENAPLIGDAIQNTFFNHGEDNLVQLGAMNIDNGVRLLMYVNGKKVFDCVDIWDGKITEPGYFGTHQYGGSITLSKAPVVKNLNDSIADTDNWYMSQGAATAGTNSITLEQGGYAIYQGEQFQDELLELTMNTEAVGWPSITLRNQSSTEDGIGANSSCYITVIKPDVIELQRFNNGVRVPLYITGIGENAPKIGDAIPNTFFTHGKDNIVHIGAINTDEGVRLTMYVNGVTVFDCVDIWDGKITEQGYFGTYQASAPITLNNTPESTSLSEVIADTDNWHMSAGTAIAATNNISFEQGGYAIYQGKQFQDEMLEFYMDTPAAGWPSITFRNQSNIADGIGVDSSSYITVIKPDVIELQRFNAGTRTVFYGNIGENPGLIASAIPNTFFTHGQDNLVQLGAVNTDAGVRLIMYINGKKVFDCIDQWDGKITTPGYFGTYQASAPIKLSKRFDTTTAVEKFALLDFEVTKVADMIASAPIGTAEGEYALWAKEYLTTVLAQTQEFRNNADDSTSQETVNAALGKLKAAEAVFEKSQNLLSNIAVGKTVTSSDGENVYVGYEPKSLVDGTVSPTNGWSPNQFETINGWAQIDLGSVSTIKRIEVVDRPDYPDQDGARKNFEIQASNSPDFETYEILGTVDSEGFADDTTWQLDLPEGTKFRYIRYQKTAPNYFFVSEIRVLGAVAPDIYTISGKVENQAHQPMEGAEINIYSFDDQNTSLGTATTVADGTYTILTEQLAGKYVVKAIKGADDGKTTVYVPFAAVNDADITLIHKNDDSPVVTTPGTSVIENITIGNDGKISATPTLNQNAQAITTLTADDINRASQKLAAGSDGIKVIPIEVKKVNGAKEYVQNLPVTALSNVSATQKLQMMTELGTVTVPSNMFIQEFAEGATEIALSIKKADLSTQDSELRNKIGDRPVIELSLKVKGVEKPWNNLAATVNVSIPYTPTTDELLDPEHIVVWYINNSGQAMPVPNGRYDSATGMVDFSTSHFSSYAVSYLKKTFGDIAGYDWAKKQIEVMASKGIISGTSRNTYNPGASIKRGDFILLLVKALGLNAEFDSNFSDVSTKDYYYDALGIAKKLGIASGVGNNKFNPQAHISRQEMMTLIYKAMNAAGKDLQKGSETSLDRFADKDSIASYAVESMLTLVRNGIVEGNGKNIDPLGNATRAETAVMIYKIYNN